MSHCPESFRAQDYLDGELVPAEREAFEAHLARCAICDREVAVYRRVFASMTAIETWDPGPAFTERVMAEVMPKRAGRWVPAVAWAAGGSLFATAATIAVATLLPGPRAWTLDLFADATRSLAGSFVFLLKSFNTGVLRALEGVGAWGGLLTRLGGFARTLVLSASHPAVAFTLWSALLVGGALLWWMRPREHRSTGEDRHVGLLGL